MSQCGLVSGPAVSGVIENQLSAITGKGDAAYATAMAAMQQMATVFGSSVASVGVWQPGTPGSGGTEAIQFVKPSPKPSDPEPLDLPVPPNVGSLNSEDLEAMLSSVFAELKRLIGDLPDPPNVLVEDLFLNYFANYYAQLSYQLSSMLSGTPVVSLALTRLNEWLQPTAIGMPVAVERALRDRGQADIDASLARSEQEAIDGWAARGFSLPAGVLDLSLARARTEAVDQRAKLNRDVLIQSGEWERDARKFGIEKGLTYDANVRDSFFKLSTEARSIAATWQENHIKVKLAAVEIYKAEIEGFGKAADALLAMGAAASQLIDAKLNLARIALERYDALLKGEIAKSDFAIKLHANQIELYKQDALSEVSRVEVLAKTDERLLARERINADIDIKSRELELQKVIETARIAVSALDGIARTASQISGSVYSALNMGAEMRVSSNYDNNSSCSTNYNISQ